jgi:hypothetical protein
MSTTCTIGKDGKKYYFHKGKRISARGVSSGVVCGPSQRKVKKVVAKPSPPKRVPSPAGRAKELQAAQALFEAPRPAEAMVLATVPKTPPKETPKLEKIKSALSVSTQSSPKSPLPKDQEVYLWTLKIMDTPAGTLIIPDKHVGFARKADVKNPAKYVELYQKHHVTIPSFMFWVSPSTHAALEQFRDTRTRWGLDEWRYFDAIIYPQLAKHFNVIKVDPKKFKKVMIPQVAPAAYAVKPYKRKRAMPLAEMGEVPEAQKAQILPPSPQKQYTTREVRRLFGEPESPPQELTTQEIRTLFEERPKKKKSSPKKRKSSPKKRKSSPSAKRYSPTTERELALLGRI